MRFIDFSPDTNNFAETVICANCYIVAFNKAVAGI